MAGERPAKRGIELAIQRIIVVSTLLLTHIDRLATAKNIDSGH